MATKPSGGNRAKQFALLLLLAPFIATLYIPFYNTTTPAVFGIPFFYFYLLLWVPISAVITGVVYAITR